MGLKEIIKNNHYPIIFIGSGIPKRYLKNSPNWPDLLKEYWDRLGLGKRQNYYSFLRSLDNQFLSRYGDNASKDSRKFYTNTKVASYIEKEFNDQFFKELTSVDGLTLQRAQEEMISPFKFDITNRFSKLELQDDVNKEELKLFKEVINKARIIVTTNYDKFIENILIKDFNQTPTVYVGNKGFFNETDGWSEIYKIHGSVSDSKSIVITDKDYESYDKNSILISAKILSSMINSPIIFLGYSLQDRNVRTLLNDFSKQLPSEDPRKSANRIIVINHDAGNQDVNERIITIENSDITCTAIDTDNYSYIYQQILKIDEGASPFEVKKYERLIRKLIISSGEKGTLKSVMISPDDLDDLDKRIDKNEPVVMALGDSKYFYVYPDLLSYVIDYFNNTHNYAPEVALSFVAHEGNSKTRIPFSRYWKNVDLKSTSLSKNSIKNLQNKINECGNHADINKSILQSYKIRFTKIDDASQAAASSRTKFYELLSYNINNIDKDELKEFVINTVLPEFKDTIKNNTNLKSPIRKFLVAYDFLINGPLK